ncbi:MAG: hypothetical protein NTZ16_05545 [Verrucomicrobia bacterium]|nr:hypothetical protein [Verrucomicrobiota bacterium]
MKTGNHLLPGQNMPVQIHNGLLPGQNMAMEISSDLLPEQNRPAQIHSDLLPGQNLTAKTRSDCLPRKRLPAEMACDLRPAPERPGKTGAGGRMGNPRARDLQPLSENDGSPFPGKTLWTNPFARKKVKSVKSNRLQTRSSIHC